MIRPFEEKIGWNGDALRVPTLHGVTAAAIGDWILKGPSGDVWPCKPDIFEQTYEPAGEELSYQINVDGSLVPIPRTSVADDPGCECEQCVDHRRGTQVAP